MLTPSDQGPVARAELETIVASLRVHELLRLVIMGRLLLDETRMMLTPSERVRHARAELETIFAALSVDQLARLGALGREIVEERSTTDTPQVPR